MFESLPGSLSFSHATGRKSDCSAPPRRLSGTAHFFIAGNLSKIISDRKPANIADSGKL